MKRYSFMSFLTFIVISSAHAQNKPSILPAPANWQLEQFSLPPEFAPAVKYHGLEELRFSPGWDKKEAKDYFTVIWGFRFDDTKNVSQGDIENFLLTYFKGLCAATARSRHLPSIDTSGISLSMHKKPAAGKAPVYELTLHIFGVFTDGSPVTLNMEIKVMEDEGRQTTYLLMIGSSQPRTGPVWPELYQVEREFEIPAQPKSATR